jgi:hypothetical protein
MEASVAGLNRDAVGGHAGPLPHRPPSDADDDSGGSSNSMIPGVTDVSFPEPGEDTVSNAAGFEYVVGQDVFWATREGMLRTCE